MTAVLAHWRTTYAPGQWIALAGPTSLVVLLPSTNGWTPMLDTVWVEVLGSTSIVELAETLVRHGLGDLPSFGAFFWGPDGMRSLIRGAVVVRDLATDAVVADGQDIQTWSEIGLAHLDRIRIETAGSEAPAGLQLPLVVGAALVSSLSLDASPDIEVRSPQAADSAEDTGDLTEAMSAQEQAAMTEDETDLLPSQPGPMSPTTTLPQMPGLAPVQLVLSDGRTIDLNQPVRIGRAPSGDDVLLVTVRSPQQDISRNHLQVDLDGEEVVVTDLHSTNGTLLKRPGDLRHVQLAAGAGTVAPLGSVLELGDDVRAVVQPSSARP